VTPPHHGFAANLSGLLLYPSLTWGADNVVSDVEDLTRFLGVLLAW
jgi:hypothetical protein